MNYLLLFVRAYFIIKEKDEIPNQANTVSTTQTSSTTEPVNKEETMDVCAIEKAVKGRYARIVSALKGTGITINEDIETAAVMISLADITANETEADRHALFEIVKNAIDKQANVVQPNLNIIDKRLDLYGKVVRKDVDPKRAWWPGDDDSIKPLLESPLARILIVYGDLLISKELQADYENGPFPIVDLFSLAEYGPLMTGTVFKEMKDYCLEIRSALKAPSILKKADDPHVDEIEVPSNVSTEYGENENISTETVANKKIPADMLRDLKSLYDQGVLTDEEYKEKKKKILGI